MFRSFSHKKRFLCTLLAATLLLSTVFFILQNNKQFSENTTQTVAQQENVEEAKVAAIDKTIDTSTWQEYCNDEYGFCVKYPEGYVADKRDKWDIKNNIILKVKSVDTSVGSLGDFAYSISIVKKEDIDYMREYLTEKNRLKDYIAESRGINSHGLEFIKFDYFVNIVDNKSEHPTSSYYIFIDKNKYIELAIYPFSYPRDETVLQMYHIMDSIKPLK